MPGSDRLSGFGRRVLPTKRNKLILRILPGDRSHVGLLGRAQLEEMGPPIGIDDDEVGCELGPGRLDENVDILRRASAVPRVADVANLRFRYRIEGDNPPWRPPQVLDDGSKVYIEFSRGIRQGEMPPLFVIGAEGRAELVNYRVRQNYYVVDRLFAGAELRLGGKGQETVPIVRTDGRAR